MISLDHVIEVALLIFVAYLGGCSLGYGLHIALRQATRPRGRILRPAPVIAPVAAPSPARRLAGLGARDEQVSVLPLQQVQRPPELPAPRQSGPDDLKRIKGIGPKTEAALNDLGIYHFDQIGAWRPAHLDWLEGRIATKGRIHREQWIEQATLLATEISSAAPLPFRKAG